jgi:hypothetical protein
MSAKDFDLEGHAVAVGRIDNVGPGRSNWQWSEWYKYSQQPEQHWHEDCEGIDRRLVLERSI